MLLQLKHRFQWRKKVKLNNSGDDRILRKSSQQTNTSSNIPTMMLPSSLNVKISKYDIMGKQRCPVEEDIYEEIDDYKVDFRDPKSLGKPLNKSNEKSTYSFEPPDNCASEEDEDDETNSPNTFFKNKVIRFYLVFPIINRLSGLIFATRNVKSTVLNLLSYYFCNIEYN